MNKNKYNPIAVILSIVSYVVAIVIAFVVRSFLPESIHAFHRLIFWLVTLGIAGPSTIFISKYFHQKGGKR